MRRSKDMQIAVVILLLTSVFFVTPIQAETTFNGDVEATITCTFETGARLTVQAQMIVNRIDDIYDTSYDRQTIESISSSDPEVMGIIKQRLRDAVKEQIEAAFSDAAVSAVNRPMYTKPYFVDEYRVNLTEAFFNYNGSMNLMNIINGVLDMGATVTYHCMLTAKPGWNTTYVYVLSSEMLLDYANTAQTNPGMNSATWTVRNWNGNDSGKEARLSVRAKNPTTSMSEAEDISLQYALDTRSVNEISLTNSIILRKIDIQEFNVLPNFISGIGIIPADGVRLFIDNGLFSWSDVYEKTIQPIEQQVSSLIENSSFAQSLSFVFSWDSESTVNCSVPFNITHMDDSPAIQARFIDSSVNLEVCDMPARALFGLVNAGASASVSSADVNFGAGLETLTLPYTILLHLPVNITLDGDNVYTWNKTRPIAGVFSSDHQPTPPYSEEHVEIRVEIELSKMDLSIPSVFSGKTQLTASTKIREDESLFVISAHQPLSFSKKVNLSYLNSDALRLCIEENVFNESMINVLLSQKTEGFEQRLSAVFQGLPVKGVIDRKVFSNSLAWDGDISSMDDVSPVIVSNSANEVYNIGFNVSLWPVSLSIMPQQFAFQGIAHQTVTYRIVFPRGITINATESNGKQVVTGDMNDGRQYVELSFDETSGNQTAVLSCVLHASPVYILGLFLPCLLAFILLIVLIVILLLIRKKKGGLRRGKRKVFEPEDNEPVEYAEQEYYVPPPPQSGRKKK